MWFQHLQLWRYSLKHSPLLMNSSQNALYIRRGSQQWKVTRFNHSSHQKERSEQGLRCLQANYHAVIENSELTFDNCFTASLRVQLGYWQKWVSSQTIKCITHVNLLKDFSVAKIPVLTLSHLRWCLSSDTGCDPQLDRPQLFSESLHEWLCAYFYGHSSDCSSNSNWPDVNIIFVMAHSLAP